VTEAPPELTVHHLTSGRAVAWIVLAAAVLGIGDVVRRGALGSSAPGVLWTVAACLVAYVMGLRPAVAEGLTEIEVRNPLRTTTVPWADVSDVDVVDVLRVHAGQTVVRCFAVPRRRPSPVRQVRSASSYGFRLPETAPRPDPLRRPGRSRADVLAERLLDLARRLGKGGSSGTPVVTRLAPDAVVALGAALLLVAVGVGLS
jgi:Bacterial PH domain